MRSRLAYCVTLGPGVYIAMHGAAFEAANVRRDLERGMFTPAH